MGSKRKRERAFRQGVLPYLELGSWWPERLLPVGFRPIFGCEIETNSLNRDTEGSKPWVDIGKTAARDFWKAEDQWLPTWGSGTEASLNVQSVKMWQEGDCA